MANNSLTGRIIRARVILPISHPPIEDGAIWIEDGKIQKVGSWRDFSALNLPSEDLGDMVILPGFVNAHCHLELGALANFRPKTSFGFTDWIRALIDRKGLLSKDDIQTGLQFATAALQKSGVTAIADHASADGPLQDILAAPFFGRLFVECLGVSEAVATSNWHQIKGELNTLPLFSNWTHGITPHSVHALNREVLSCVMKTGDFFSIHLSESCDEAEFFNDQKGPLFDFIHSRHPTLNLDNLAKSPIAELARLKLLNRPILIVHGNTVNARDLDHLDPFKHAFVHCPGSHAYFDHPRFPLEEIEARGFLIGIGTDSAASTDSFNFLDELRRFGDSYPEKSPKDILRHATLTGAKALRLDREIGSLEPEKRADLIGFPYEGGDDPHEAPLRASQVSFSLLSQVAHKPNNSKR